MIALDWNFLQALAQPLLFAPRMLSRLGGADRDIARYRVLPDSSCVEFSIRGGHWTPLAWRPSHQDASLLLELIAKYPPDKRPTPQTFDKWYDEYRAEWQREVLAQIGAQEMEELISNVKDFVTSPGGRRPTTDELIGLMEEINKKA